MCLDNTTLSSHFSMSSKCSFRMFRWHMRQHSAPRLSGVTRGRESPLCRMWCSVDASGSWGSWVILGWPQLLLHSLTKITKMEFLDKKVGRVVNFFYVPKQLFLRQNNGHLASWMAGTERELREMKWLLNSSAARLDGQHRRGGKFSSFFKCFFWSTREDELNEDWTM